MAEEVAAAPVVEAEPEPVAEVAESSDALDAVSSEDAPVAASSDDWNFDVFEDEEPVAAAEEVAVAPVAEAEPEPEAEPEAEPELVAEVADESDALDAVSSEDAPVAASSDDWNFDVFEDEEPVAVAEEVAAAPVAEAEPEPEPEAVAEVADESDALDAVTSEDAPVAASSDDWNFDAFDDEEPVAAADLVEESAVEATPVAEATITPAHEDNAFAFLMGDHDHGEAEAEAEAEPEPEPEAEPEAVQAGIVSESAELSDVEDLVVSEPEQVSNDSDDDQQSWFDEETVDADVELISEGDETVEDVVEVEDIAEYVSDVVSDTEFNWDGVDDDFGAFVDLPPLGQVVKADRPSSVPAAATVVDEDDDMPEQVVGINELDEVDDLEDQVSSVEDEDLVMEVADVGVDDEDVDVSSFFDDDDSADAVEAVHEPVVPDDTVNANDDDAALDWLNDDDDDSSGGDDDELQKFLSGLD